MLISISLNNSTVLVLVNGKKFELTRTRTRNSNSTWLETHLYLLYPYRTRTGDLTVPITLLLLTFYILFLNVFFYLSNPRQMSQWCLWFYYSGLGIEADVVARCKMDFTSNVSGVFLQYPDTQGSVYDLTPFVSKAHANNVRTHTHARTRMPEKPPGGTYFTEFSLTILQCRTSVAVESMGTACPRRTCTPCPPDGPCTVYGCDLVILFIMANQSSPIQSSEFWLEQVFLYMQS